MAGIDKHTLFCLHLNGKFDSKGTLGLTLARQGNVEFSQGKFGQCAYLSSGTDAYYIYDDQAFGITGDFTCDCWCKGFGDNVAFVRGKDANSGASYYNYCGVVFTGSSWICGKGGWISIPNGNPNDSDWHHYALVRVNGTFISFCDGKLVSNSVSGGTYNFWTLGQEYQANTLVICGSTPNNAGSNVYVDEVRLSDVARWTSDFTPPNRPYSRSKILALSYTGGGCLAI